MCSTIDVGPLVEDKTQSRESKSSFFKKSKPLKGHDLNIETRMWLINVPNATIWSEVADAHRGFHGKKAEISDSVKRRRLEYLRQGKRYRYKWFSRERKIKNAVLPAGRFHGLGT